MTAIAMTAIGLSACGSSTTPSAAAPGTGRLPSAASSASPSPEPTPSAVASPSAIALGRPPVGRIVFSRLDGSPEGAYRGMFTVGTDGVEQPVKLPFEPDFAYSVWSSDGSKLLVDSYTDANGGAVGTYDLASASYRVIAPKGMADGLDCSDWAPDDKTVVCGFGSSDKVRDGIYAVDVATSTAKRLTHSPYHDTVGTAGECGGGESRGVFSPDGKRIAFEEQQCGTGADPSSDESGQLVVIAADGSSPHVVVPFGGVRTHPGGEISWSPRGDLIAFGTQTGELSVVAPDGTNLRQLAVPATVDGSSAIGPAWSPDGRWLLVGVGGSGRFDLFAIALNGSPPIQLTASDRTEAFTDWGVAPA
jgi:Tol biopolymer transport system component